MDHAGEIFEEDAKNLNWVTSTVELAIPLQQEILSKPKATPMPTPMPNPKHDQRSQGVGSLKGRKFRGSRVQELGRRETAMDVEPMTIEN